MQVGCPSWWLNEVCKGFEDKQQGENPTPPHLLLDAVVKLVREDLVAVVLAPNHVHALPREGVPRQELQAPPFRV